MSSISVCIRLRPYLTHERGQKGQRPRIHLNEEAKHMKVELTQQKQKFFKFNNVFGPEINQEGIYQKVDALSLVERVVQGYHSTIFAYGQTGSGKTYTIQGGDEEQTEGIVPKSIRDLFKTLQERSTSDKGYKVFISFIQIYNESIFDLIDPNDGKPLKMRWNKLQQFTVQNMFEGQCRSSEQALKWWRKGQKNKIMGSHKMNNTSSRSHCLLTFRVQSFLLEDPSQQIESKLEIVDLAGSERHKATKSTGVVFKEGIEINKSLFTLRQVIASLYESTTTGKVNLLPPYRDSKLTSLLKQSIGGNSYCLMIACLNPTMAHFEQSLQTLTYASMATYINNIPTKNIDPKIRQNVQLRQQNRQLQSQLKKLQQHIQYLTKILQTNECPQCKKKISALKKTQTQIMTKIDTSFESLEPTGLMMKKNEVDKPLSTKSINESRKKALQKTYQNLMKERNSSFNNRTLKSTKQIIQSIGMIRDLITANSTLRERIQSFKNQIQKQEKQTFLLMKENQVLRDRWDMVSANLKPEGHIAGGEEEAPIVAYQRMLKEQKGQSLKYQSLHYQTAKAERIDSEGNNSKISYNDFLKGGKKLASIKNRSDHKRKNRLYSEAKKIGSESFI